MIIESEGKTVSPNKSGQNPKRAVEDSMVEEPPISTDLYSEDSIKAKWKPLHYEAFAKLDQNLNLFSYVFHHPDEQLSSANFSKEEEDVLLMNALDIYMKNEESIVKQGKNPVAGNWGLFSIKMGLRNGLLCYTNYLQLETKAKASGDVQKYLQKRIENSDSSSILNFLKIESFLEFFHSCKPGFSQSTEQQDLSALVPEKKLLDKYILDVKRRISHSKLLKSIYEQKKPEDTKLWLMSRTDPNFLEHLKKICKNNSLLRISDMQTEEPEAQRSKSPKVQTQKIEKTVESKPATEKKKPSPPTNEALLLDKNTSTKENTITANLENVQPKEIPSLSPSRASSTSGLANRRYVRLSKTKLRNKKGKLSDESSVSDDGVSEKKSNIGKILEKYGIVNKTPFMIDDYDSEPENKKPNNFQENAELDLKPFFSEISSLTGSNSEQGASDFLEDSASEINGLLKEIRKTKPEEANKELRNLDLNSAIPLKRKGSSKKLETKLTKKIPKLLNKSSVVPKPKLTRKPKAKKESKPHRRRVSKKLIEGIPPRPRNVEESKQRRKSKEKEIITNKNSRNDKSIDESSSLEDFIVEDSMMIEEENEQEIVTGRRRAPPKKKPTKRKKTQIQEEENKPPVGPTLNFFQFKKTFSSHLETHLNELLDSHLKCPERNSNNSNAESRDFLPLNFDMAFNGLNVSDDHMELDKLLNGLCELSPIIKTMLGQLEAVNLNFLQQSQNFLSHKQLYSISQLSEGIKVKLRALNRFWPKKLGDITSNKSIMKIISKIDGYLCAILRLEVTNPIIPVILRNRNPEYEGRIVIENLLFTNLENLFIIFDIFSEKLGFALKECGYLWRVYAKLGLRVLPCCYLQILSESSLESEQEQKQAAIKRSFKLLLNAFRGSPQELAKTVQLLATNFLENFQRFVSNILLNEQLHAKFADNLFDESKIWKFLVLSTHEFIEETQQNLPESDKLILQTFSNTVNTFVLVDALGLPTNRSLWHNFKHYQKEFIQEIKSKAHKFLISCGSFIFDVFCELEPENSLKDIKKAQLIKILGTYLDQIQTFEELGRFNADILLRFIREIKPSSEFFFKYYEISKKLLKDHMKKLEVAALDQFIHDQKLTFSQYTHAVTSIATASSSIFDLKAENIILIASALLPLTFEAESTTLSSMEIERKLRQLVSKSMGLIPPPYKLDSRLSPDQAAQLLLNCGLFLALFYTTGKHPEMLQGILPKLYSFIAEPEKSNIYGKMIVMNMYHEIADFIAKKLTDLSRASCRANENHIRIYTNAIKDLLQRSNKVLSSLIDDSMELSHYANIFEGPGSTDSQMNTRYMRLQGLLETNFLSLKLFAKERFPIIIKENINLFIYITPKIMAVLNPLQPFVKSVRKSLLGLLTELLIEDSEFERRNSSQNNADFDIETLSDQEIEELLSSREKFLDKRREFVDMIQKDYMKLFFDTIYSL